MGSVLSIYFVGSAGGLSTKGMNDTALHNEMYRAVRSYLANTGLLNRGWVKEYDDKQ